MTTADADRLPPGDAVHHLSHPVDWQAALVFVRRDGWWGQYAGACLGRRHGRLVEVHKVESWNPEQDPGEKGYLDDDDVMWHVDLLCAPLSSDLKRPFDLVGSTVVIQGCAALDLSATGMIWSVFNGQDSPGDVLFGCGLKPPIREAQSADLEFRLEVRARAGSADADDPSWEQTAPMTDPDFPSGWRRGFGAWEIDARFRGTSPQLTDHVTRLLDDAWSLG